MEYLRPLEPPPTPGLPVAWRRTAIRMVRLGPRYALACANLLELAFSHPVDDPARGDARILADWLRASARR